MTILTEGRHVGEFLVSEAEGTLSREEVTVTQAGAPIVSGTVLGKITTGATSVGTVTFAGTGNGTCTKATPAYGTGVLAGDYKATCVGTGANVGTFNITRPDGTVDGVATVGVAYTGQVKFTIADGSTDFVAGDTFTIPVTIAAGSGKYVPYSNAATDGSGVAAGVLYTNIPGTASGDVTKCVVIVRNAEVFGDALTGNDANGTADLKALNVIVR